VSGEWTEEEKALLVREYKNRSLPEVAKIMGRSYHAVKNKMRGMGLTKQPGRKDRPTERTVRINPLGKHERIPPMPCCLLWHLKEMEGCMDTAIVLPNRTQREYQDRLHAAKPIIKEMLQKRMSGSAIAKAMGMRYSTVYGYIKEIRAAA
jgi:transposase